MRKIVVSILLTVLTAAGSATLQADSLSDNYGLFFSGFVRSDLMWDSRQTVSAREGVFLLWPAKPLYDINGIDVNDRSNLNILSVLSRLRADITGPEAFGAETSGVLEFDFFGTADDFTGLVRMRHGYLRMVWNGGTELLAGQYWNPLFIVENHPQTVTISSGTPFNSFSRNPQVRLTAVAGNFSLIAAALSQRDFPSVASPDGLTSVTSSDYLRNSSLPDMHLQVHYKSSPADGSSFITGGGVAWKRIVPGLTIPGTTQTLESSAVVEGLSAIAFAGLTTPSMSVKFYARYAENLNDIVNQGGYGISGINVTTSQYEYLPLRNVSYWADFQTNGERVRAGLFAGYLCNRGSSKELYGEQPSLFGRAMDIARLMRVSPRVIFSSGRATVGAEAEHTTAWYGDGTYDSYGRPLNREAVSNLRLITTITYSF